MPGSLALRLLGAEELITRSAAFRARVQAASAEAAKSSVHFGELGSVLEMAVGASLSIKRPCAIIGIESHSYVQIGQGAALELAACGAVWVIFTAEPRPADDQKASMLDFVDWFSSVMDQVAAEVGQDALWPFTRPEMFFEPFRPDVSARRAEDYWVAGYLLHDHIEG